MVRYLVPLGVVVGLSACVQSGLSESPPAVSLDAHYFRCQVQPLLTRGCAFMDCHGNEERALRIYAEQRFRLDVDWLDYERPITQAELDANFAALEAFAASGGSESELLSEKPLDTSAGGLFHRGKDLYGERDVYLSRQDPDYRKLRSFLGGATALPSCTPEEQGP